MYIFVLNSYEIGKLLQKVVEIRQADCKGRGEIILTEINTTIGVFILE